MNRVANRRTLMRLAVVAAAMFGFGYALVPFYDAICRALGVNEFIQADARPAGNTQVDASRTITVELDANVHDVPMHFKPLVRYVKVHPGELATVEYEIANVRGAPVTAQAVPSYGPARAAEHFRKMECFCFTQQTLAAGETRRMPLVFMVDPKLPRDVNTITLSYTFFEVAGRGGRS
ncbi:MAG: cytochrome c oxidase assembly protein [Betaproteobacteria bacterium]|nr:cytochrome c oxidase assembly protein [Betaproteobacteria bacterium]MDH5221098.1 cytochrome c oxidase assembly protein [Betaproteobacteria bacterium]MDH5349204.1 cytochrome c oxidase assembly protein [Betaproteobacteria bacterium]